MSDIRPVKREDSFSVRKTLPVEQTSESVVPKPVEVATLIQSAKRPTSKEARVYQMGHSFTREELPVYYRSDFQASRPVLNRSAEHAAVAAEARESYVELQRSALARAQALAKKSVAVPQVEVTNDFHSEAREEIFAAPERQDGFSFAQTFATHLNKLAIPRVLFSFGSVALVIFILIFGTGFFFKALRIKDTALLAGQSAYANLTQAKESVLSRDFVRSGTDFQSAGERFEEISRELDGMGSVLIETSRYVPFLSKLSTGRYLAKAGEDGARVGVLMGEILADLEGVKNSAGQTEPVSFLAIFQRTDRNLREIETRLESIEASLAKVNTDDIPEEKRAQFVEMKKKLPLLQSVVGEFTKNSQIFTDVLGGNGPRKYLFLFQNNQEMRATGGFIGTYGVLDIFNGRIRNFFIDGIFNPDGQLREKVVPPEPIQKISAAWSLHDSNWFPNFPTSAEKATWFYEKTGGPTVDGVITMTPTVMQKLLKITGPIEMPDYGVTVDQNNFLEKIQYEVEVDYDKELNQPKKILADLAPKILDRIFNVENVADIAKTANVLLESLNEKQILIYSKNYNIEKKISEMGWSGELLAAEKDYLSVINSNINGYKTDGVVEEKIEHQAEIQADGSIIDIVTITRHHNGGNSEFEWWNKVNANYMRVYVPKGSQLLSAQGQTREFNSPPLDYGALNFKRDAQVEVLEQATTIDEATGTRISEEDDKTVFANWVYVSPQETVRVEYKYLLPFRIEPGVKNKPADTYSLVAQKQSGSVGSQFVSQVAYPENFSLLWKYPEGGATENNILKMETNLATDKFVGIAFTPH